MYWTLVSLASVDSTSNNVSNPSFQRPDTQNSLYIRRLFRPMFSTIKALDGVKRLLAQNIKLSWLDGFSGDATPCTCEWPDAENDSQLFL